MEMAEILRKTDRVVLTQDQIDSWFEKNRFPLFKPEDFSCVTETDILKIRVYLLLQNQGIAVMNSKPMMESIEGFRALWVPHRYDLYLCSNGKQHKIDISPNMHNYCLHAHDYYCLLLVINLSELYREILQAIDNNFVNDNQTGGWMAERPITSAGDGYR
jgi:hypothetical protein